MPIPQATSCGLAPAACRSPPPAHSAPATCPIANTALVPPALRPWASAGQRPLALRAQTFWAERWAGRGSGAGRSLQAEAPGTQRAVPELSGGQRSCVRRAVAISRGGQMRVLERPRRPVRAGGRGGAAARGGGQDPPGQEPWGEGLELWRVQAGTAGWVPGPGPPGVLRGGLHGPHTRSGLFRPGHRRLPAFSSFLHTPDKKP